MTGEAKTLAPLLGPIGGGFSALGLVATAPSPSGAGSAAAEASSSARTTSLLPCGLPGTDAKPTRPLPAAGTPAASMNREVADAMLVLAMGWHARSRSAADLLPPLASSRWMESE